jgi:hypothetical protein
MQSICVTELLTTQISISGNALSQHNSNRWHKTGSWDAPDGKYLAVTGAIQVSGGPSGRNLTLCGACTQNTKIMIRSTVVEALHLGHVFCRTQTSKASASEDPYEAALEYAVDEHDLEEQPRKKKIINELLGWIKVNRWNLSDHSDKVIKVFIRSELDALKLSAGIHARSCCSKRSQQ